MAVTGLFRQNLGPLESLPWAKTPCKFRAFEEEAPLPHHAWPLGRADRQANAPNRRLS